MTFFGKHKEINKMALFLTCSAVLSQEYYQKKALL